MAFNTIMLTKGFRHEEYLAEAAFYPGHLIELTSSETVQKHSTEGGYAERMVAVEDALQGNAISDAYSADDLAMCALIDPGDEGYIYLASGESVSIGDKLVSDGSGRLIAEGSVASGTTVKQIIATALEAEDLSASTAVDTRIRVRFL